MTQERDYFNEPVSLGGKPKTASAEAIEFLIDQCGCSGDMVANFVLQPAEKQEEIVETILGDICSGTNWRPLYDELYRQFENRLIALHRTLLIHAPKNED